MVAEMTNTAVVTDAHYRMATSLIRDLGEAGIRVIACDYEDISANPGFASKYVSRVVQLPREKERYEDALFYLCDGLRAKGERAALLPVGAGSLSIVAEAAERFRSICGVAAPSPETLALYNDKTAVGNMAESLGIPTPKKYSARFSSPEQFLSSVEYPAVVKPPCGEKFGIKAESRYKIVLNAKELEAAHAHFFKITGEPPIVEEYLPGGGTGCSVLCDKGTVKAYICHSRIREHPVSGGPSSCCETIDGAERVRSMVRDAEKFTSATGFTGVAMFEFKEGADGVQRLLEINPRVWGTYPLTRVSKSNFSLMWYSLAAGIPLPEFIPPRRARMVYYPSDFAAMLGYIKRGDIGKFFEGARDFFSPGVKNGLAERGDRKPMTEYLKSLRGRGRR